MLEIKENGAIYLTRGDSAYLEVNIKHKGKDYVAQDGDILTFSVKKYVDDEDYIIHKTFKAENAIVINPEDTKLCAFGKYKNVVHVKCLKRYNFVGFYITGSSYSNSVQIF